MKPKDVRFHHIRDYPWRQVFCKYCWRMVPYFHEHWTKDEK